MKNKIILAVLTVAISASLSYAGSNGKAIGAGSTVKSRINSMVSSGQPIRLEEKGVKQFHVYNEATGQQVVDENGDAPTSGALVSIEVYGDTACYAYLFDSAVATNLALATYARMMIPPLLGSDAKTTVYEFKYPKQFNRGLVIQLSSASTGCRATCGWKRNGGAD